MSKLMKRICNEKLLKSLFENMMSDLMGDEFGCLDALKITNCDEKRRKWCSRAFKNEGDVILPKY